MAVLVALALAPLAVTTLATPTALATDDESSITVGPTTLEFPDTYVGTSSPPQYVTLTNTGSTTVHPALAGGALIARTDFADDGQTCGTLAPGDSCAFRYHFTPTKSGPLTDHTTIGVDGVNYPITLSGKGIESFTVAPTTLAFPDTAVGLSTPKQSVVLTNISPVPLHPMLAGGALIARTDFADDGQTCGTVQPGDSCAFHYHFAPTQPGALTDHTTIGVNGVNYPITVTGTGLIGFTVAPTNLVFDDTVIGSITPELAVVLTNTTSVTLHPTLSGGALIARTDFADDGQTCGAVPAGGICMFRYHFAPTTLGPLTDHTTIGVNGATFDITLSGSGITGVDLTPSTLLFADTAVGTQSAPLQVTLTNITSQVLHPGISGGGLTHGTDFSFRGTNCPDTMNPGQACRAEYAFSPASSGQHTDTATFTIAGQAVTISLVGGHDPVTTATTAHTTAHTTAATTAPAHATTRTTHATTTTTHTTGHASPPGARATDPGDTPTTGRSTGASGSGADTATSDIDASSGPATSSQPPTGPVTSGAAPSSSAASTAVTSSSVAVVALSAPSSDPTSSWLWLWIVIGVLVVAGIGVGAVAFARARRG